MSVRTGIVAGLLCVLFASQAGQGAIVSTFDTDLDGWSMVKRNGTLQWQDPGGNPDGFGFFTDTRGGLSSIKAPSKFLGDLSAYDQGEMTFDYKVFDLGAGVRRYSPIQVTIYSGGKHLTFKAGTPNATWEGLGWQTLTVPLTAADWHVSQAKWDAILSNVTKLQISMESAVNNKKPFDTDGIDNIIITGLGQPTPEPATLALLGLGAAALLRRRKPAKA